MAPVLVCLTFLWSAPSEGQPQCPVLVLNGSSSYATASRTVFPNTTSLVSFTAEAWIYPGFIPFDHNTQVIASDDAWDLLLNYVPAQSLVRLGVSLYGANGLGLTFLDTRVVNINQWHHVAVVFDASVKRLRIVLDGVVGTPLDVNLNDFGTFSNNFIVGGFPPSVLFFSGHIDELRISDVARYSANFTPPASLAVDANVRALYRFSEAFGATTFADLSGNGNTLTGTGGAQTANTGSCVPAPGAAPTVTSITPPRGPAAGGTPVTITGTNFITGATVAIGGVAATNVVVSNAATITATTGARVAGLVNVVVTNSNLQTNTLFSGFRYQQAFTDETLAATVSVIRAVHVMELRTRIDAIRAARLLPAFSWTDTTLSAGITAIQAIHITELREALRQTYLSALMPPPTYTDPSLGIGTTMKAVHVTQLRAAVLAIE